MAYQHLPRDLGNIKKDYPELISDAPKELLEPLYRVSSVLVGYKVSLSISMPKSLYDSVKDAYNKAREHGGSVSLLGMNIGGGANVTTKDSTDFSDVKTHDATHTFEIPASNNSFPVLLGVLARKTGD